MSNAALVKRMMGVALALALVPAAAHAAMPVHGGEPSLILDARSPTPVWKSGGIPAAAWREGEALVKLRPGIGRAEAMTAMTAARLGVAREFPLLSARRGSQYLLVRSEGMTTGDLLSALRRDPAVESAWPNLIMTADALPYDPRFSMQWGLHNIGQEVLGVSGLPDADIDAPEAWDLTTGSPETVVAVIDTGVDWTHEDLAENIWVNEAELNGSPGVDDDGNGYVDDLHGFDFVNDDPFPMDDAGHGTHVAGIIAAAGNNGRGVAGVAWQARIMALKFLDTFGRGDTADAIRALEYVLEMKVDRGVNIVAVNASWGSNPMEPDDAGPLREIIEETGKAGIVFCAAAGNYGMSNEGNYFRSYPASYTLPNIITVAASDSNDLLASWSNYGRASVDLAAPGDAILSSIPGGGYEPGLLGTDIFFDDLESGAIHWTHGGYNDRWALTGGDPERPGSAWSANALESPVMGTDSWLALGHDLDLTGHSAEVVSLAFWARTDLGTRDGGSAEATLAVEISPDGGLSWGWYEPLGRLPVTSDWTLHRYLIPFAWQTSRFRFRFHLRGTADDLAHGVRIDDVGVGIASSRDYALMSGTSMATPFVTGAVALAASLYPEEGVFSRISRILSGVDEQEGLGSWTRTGGRLNVASSLQPDLARRPWIMNSGSLSGAVPGKRVKVKGVSFGDAAGRAIFSGNPAGSLRTGRFRFMFHVNGICDWIDPPPHMSEYDIYIDDVRVWSESGTWFADDMESGTDKWSAFGWPNSWDGGPAEPPWALTGSYAHSGSASWSTHHPISPDKVDSYYMGAYLLPAADIDLSAVPAGEKVRFGFWLHNYGIPLEIFFSGRGAADFRPVAKLDGVTHVWTWYEFEVPGEPLAQAGPVISWSDTGAVVTVPVGAGKQLLLESAGGRASLESLLVTAWEDMADSRIIEAGETVALDGKIYRFGARWGQDSSLPPRMAAAVYEPESDRWTERGELASPLNAWFRAPVAVGGRIYLLGGQADALYGYSTDAVHSLDPASATWRSETSMPASLVRPGVVSIGRGIFVSGGSQYLPGACEGCSEGFDASRGLYRYDTVTREWTRLADMAHPRADHAAVALGGRIYVFGGVDEEGNPVSSGEVYDPATDAWSPLPEMPLLGLSRMGAASDGKLIYLVGGWQSHPWGQPTLTFLAYDPAKGEWQPTAGSICELLEARFGSMTFLPGWGLHLVGDEWDGERYDTFTQRLDIQRTWPALTLLAPDGGERLRSGRAAVIHWGTPPGAVRFDVDLTLNGGTSWRRLAEKTKATSLNWRIPPVAKRRKNCRVRVKGYDREGMLTGSDRSDRPFTIIPP